MTDSEFEDLVNRYLDRDVELVEIEFLKDEVRSNTSRCLIFQEYVAMHRASQAAMTQPVVHKIGVGRLLGSAALGVVVASIATYFAMQNSQLSLDGPELVASDSIGEGTLTLPRAILQEMSFVMDERESRAQVQELIRRHFESMKQQFDMDAQLVDFSTNAKGDTTIRFEIVGPQRNNLRNRSLEPILTTTTIEDSFEKEMGSMATFSIYR